MTSEKHGCVHSAVQGGAIKCGKGSVARWLAKPMCSERAPSPPPHFRLVQERGLLQALLACLRSVVEQQLHNMAQSESMDDLFFIPRDQVWEEKEGKGEGGTRRGGGAGEEGGGRQAWGPTGREGA